MAYSDNDYVKVDFDLYANGKLVQTTSEKKGKEAGLDIKEYGESPMILGKAFVLKAFDEAIKKKDKDSIELSVDEAYGKRRKDLLKTFPKSSFDEQQIRAVPGVTYDFNGMFGTVKSVVGGRVMVDFNNPLSGKDIKIDYEVKSKITKIDEKVAIILESVLRVPANMFEASSKDKNVILKVPQELSQMKEVLENSFKELIPEFKDYKLKLELKK